MHKVPKGVTDIKMHYGGRPPANGKKSCFLLIANLLPLYCLEQFPKFQGNRWSSFFRYAPKYASNCGVGIPL